MIHALLLTNFRNHISKRIDTAAPVIIITGPNGSGKTAILEAVSMLGGDRGLRGAAYDQVANNKSDNFSIFARTSDDTEISISWNSGISNRRVKIDGDNAKMEDLARLFSVIWLTPAEDRLFVLPAADRRAFFDRLIAGFDPAHYGRVRRLTKLLYERAFALKNFSDNNLLEVIDTQIAATSVAIAYDRKAYISEINRRLGDAISINLQGRLESSNLSAAETEMEYLDYLRNNRVLIADKMSIDGVHKSDFIVMSYKHNMHADQLSTGQQKSVLTDVVLAHSKLIKNPIILLDEAYAHLDAVNRDKLFDGLGRAKAQVWATGIDAQNFSGIKSAVFVEL